LRYGVNIKSALNASAVGVNLVFGFAPQTFVTSTTTIACFLESAVTTTAESLVDTSVADLHK
jgi:hypothetical protein